MRNSIRLAAACLGVLGLGCAHSSIFDLTGKATSLEQAHKKYTELVRWGEIERASEYVDPEELEEYLRDAAAFEGIRFTDFETSKLTLGEDKNTATVLVIYHAYSMRTFVEKQIRERQEWYREAGRSNTWRVRPELRQIAAGMAGR